MPGYDPRLKRLSIQIPCELYDALNEVVTKRRHEDALVRNSLRKVVMDYLFVGIVREWPMKAQEYAALVACLADAGWAARAAEDEDNATT